MLIIAFASFVLITVTVLLHYEVLRALNRLLPALNIPSRTKLLVALFAAFVAHLAEMVIYGVAIFLLIEYAGMGNLKGLARCRCSTAFIFPPRPTHRWGLATSRRSVR